MIVMSDRMNRWLADTRATATKIPPAGRFAGAVLLFPAADHRPLLLPARHSGLYTGARKVRCLVVISCFESINHVWATVWSQIVVGVPVFSACMDAHRPGGNQSFCLSVCVGDIGPASFR